MLNRMQKLYRKPNRIIIEITRLNWLKETINTDSVRPENLYNLYSNIQFTSIHKSLYCTKLTSWPFSASRVYDNDI